MANRQNDSATFRYGHRARVFVVDGGDLVVLRRKRPDRAEPYHAIPGGGVEESDASVEDAMRREVMEELGAVVGSAQQVFVVTGRDWERRRTMQHYFLANLLSIDFERRIGEEHHDASRGVFAEARVPFTVAAIAAAGFNDRETDYLTRNHDALKALACELRRVDAGDDEDGHGDGHGDPDRDGHGDPDLRPSAS